MSSLRVKLALFGVGRLGSIRARNLLSSLRIELVAVCDPKPGSDEWVRDNLPSSVKYYADPEECMRSGVEAVLISTATATHAPLVLRALELDLHVMVEKPIAVDIETTKLVLEAVKAKPQLKFLVPFCRRFDESYRTAKRMVDAGELGEIHAVESHMMDRQDPTGFFVSFSAQSGGIFVDMGVHDIDIARYFLGVDKNLPNPKKQVERVFAMGQVAVYDGLKQYNDADNGWGLVQFTNGSILNFHIGRTLTNGHEAGTRLFGTKGSLVINGHSTVDRVEVRDQYGMRTQTTPDPFVLYEKSFVNDLQDFATAILDNQPLSFRPEDALEASKIATALQYSFRNNVPIYFNDEGEPIMK